MDQFVVYRDCDHRLAGARQDMDLVPIKPNTGVVTFQRHLRIGFARQTGLSEVLTWIQK